MIREHLSNFSIAGFTYYEGALAFEHLKIGTKLRLELDEANKYDPRAVAIYFENKKLGFIPRSENRIFYKLLKVGFENFEARVQRIAPQEHPEEQLRVVVHLVENKGTN